MTWNMASYELPAELLHAVDRGFAGDETSRPQVREFLDAMPEYRSRAGDSGWQALLSLINWVAENCVVSQEAMMLQAEELRTRLHAESTSDLEIALADRVAVCSSISGIMENVLVLSLANKSPESVRATYERFTTAITNRFLAATKTLAEVRRLLRPAQPRTAALNSTDAEPRTTPQNDGDGQVAASAENKPPAAATKQTIEKKRRPP